MNNKEDNTPKSPLVSHTDVYRSDEENSDFDTTDNPLHNKSDKDLETATDLSKITKLRKTSVQTLMESLSSVVGIGSQIALFSLIKTVVPSAINYFVFEETNSALFFVAAVTAPYSFEIIKLLFNMSSRDYRQVQLLSKIDENAPNPNAIEKQTLVIASAKGNHIVYFRRDLPYRFSKELFDLIYADVLTQDERDLYRGDSPLHLSAEASARAVAALGYAPMGLKKDFNLYWNAATARMFLWVGLSVYYFYHENLWQNLDILDASLLILVPELCLQLLTEFVLAPYVQKHKQMPVLHFMYDYFLQETADRTYLNRWYNAYSIHFARFIILNSALIAGSILFGKLVIGVYIAALVQALAITAPAAIAAFGMQFNEMVGTTLFILTGLFQPVPCSYASRASVSALMTSSFQMLALALAFFNEENIAVVLLAGNVTFLVDLVLQHTVVARSIDEKVNGVVYTGAAKLLSCFGLLSSQENKEETISRSHSLSRSNEGV